MTSWTWELRAVGLFGFTDPTVIKRRQVVFTRTHLKLLHTLSVSPQLMPRIMTMNGDHQSVATAPLDLRTTNRERGSAGSKTPDCKGRACNARVTGGSQAPPACTGTDSLEIHCDGVRNATGSETNVARKRPVDRSSSKLPFRKRPFYVEPETQRQSPAPPDSGDRFSPEEDTRLTVRESLATGLERPPYESRVGVTPVTPRTVEGTGQHIEGYPVCTFLPPFNYGKRLWPTFSLLHHYHTMSFCKMFIFNNLSLCRLCCTKI